MKLTYAACALLGLASPALAADGGANPFAGTIAQAVAAAIVFIVVLVVLKAKAWGPILKGLQDREQKIQNDLQQAERFNKEASGTLEQYKKQLADAQVEAAKLIEQGRTDAQRLAAKLKEQTEHELGVMRQRAEADINQAKQQALNEIYAQTAALATQVAGRILQREINPQEQRDLVDQALTEFQRTSN